MPQTIGAAGRAIRLVAGIVLGLVTPAPAAFRVRPLYRLARIRTCQ